MSSWKTSHGYARFVNDEENGLNPHATYVVNTSLSRKCSCILFLLNYSIHQHALALDVIQVLNGRNLFSLLVNTVHCMFTATVSLGN